MALKFLNKKGWHTGSLRNIENVWKAEQKHEAEKRKLEELKKQIHDEREAQEFRLLQEQAGLVPKQERLEFLYDSGLAVGRNSTDDYLLGKPVEEDKKEDDVAKVAAAPGALFVEEKPQSANDAWRKLHTDPLLLIRQQEQAALQRIRNNPVKMDLIRRSVGEKIINKEKENKDKKVKKHKDRRKKQQYADSSDMACKVAQTSLDKKALDRHEADNLRPEDDSNGEGRLSKKEVGNPTKRNYCSPTRKHESSQRNREILYDSPERRRGSRERVRQNNFERKRNGSSERRRPDSPVRRHDSYKRRHGSPETRHDRFKRRHDSPDDSFEAVRHKQVYREGGEYRKSPPTEIEVDTSKIYSEDCHTKLMEWNKQKMKQQNRKLTEEEKTARLKAMQNDAEVHEEQRWHRLKKASDADQLEELRRHSTCSGRNFVDQTARNIYGAARGGSASVEESVKRRTHFIERSIGDSNFNTFIRS